MPLFEFQFLQTEADILLYNKTFLIKKKMTKIIVFTCLFVTIGLVIGLVSFFNILMGGYLSDNLFGLFIAAVFMILGACYYPICLGFQKIAVKGMLENDKTQTGLNTVTLYEDKFCERSDLISIEIAYTAFTEFFVTPEMICFMTGVNIGYLIPRRLFDDQTWGWLCNFCLSRCTAYNIPYKIYQK